MRDLCQLASDIMQKYSAAFKAIQNDCTLPPIALIMTQKEISVAESQICSLLTNRIN